MEGGYEFLTAICMWIRIHIYSVVRGEKVKTIQMTIDEDLLSDVDRVIRSLETNRSAFIRNALRLAIKRYEIREMEKRHISGYEKYPVEKGEFDIWQDEQVWGVA